MLKSPNAHPPAGIQRGRVHHLLRRHWLLLLFTILVGASLAAQANGGALAAPLEQGRTVPTATPTNPGRGEPTPTRVRAEPTATPRPSATPAVGNGAGGGGGASATSTVAPPLLGAVSVAQLTLYGEPSLTAQSVGSLLQGARVELLGRTANGSWLHVCCSAGGATGWVLARFIEGDFDLSTLPLVTGGASAPSTTLGLSMSVSNAAVRPGQAVELTFIITNQGDAAAQEVQLYNELPAQLRFVRFQAPGAQVMRQDALLSARWPELAAGQSLTATLSLQVASNVRPSQIIDNLAGVRAANATDVGMGVSLGLPPAAPPDFRP